MIFARLWTCVVSSTNSHCSCRLQICAVWPSSFTMMACHGKERAFLAMVHPKGKMPMARQHRHADCLSTGWRLRTQHLFTVIKNHLNAVRLCFSPIFRACFQQILSRDNKHSRTAFQWFLPDFGHVLSPQPTVTAHVGYKSVQYGHRVLQWWPAMEKREHFWLWFIPRVKCQWPGSIDMQTAWALAGDWGHSTCSQS